MSSLALSLDTDPRAAVQPDDAALFRRGNGTAEGSDRASFASVLGKLRQDGHESPEAYARRSAESFVAIGLVQPVLKKLRESNNAAPPFAPTDAEKQFRSLADADLAQHIVHAKNFPLVDRIARQLIEKARSRAGRTDVPGPNSSSNGLPAIPWSEA
ncbi:MAG TPA: hypothetical protein VHC70_12745 [Phycisphaerales bacterium]|nr:hypothetical protein [Phycisphaerales bacterium]